MSDSTATPEADAAPPVAGTQTGGPSEAPAAASTQGELGKALEAQELSIRSLLEAGAHYGHQPGRWNPLMRSYLFGERNGTHIIDLDQTLPLLRNALDFLRETTANGGIRVEVPAELAIIKRIRDLKQNGLTDASIARVLNAANVPTISQPLAKGI